MMRARALRGLRVDQLTSPAGLMAVLWFIINNSLSAAATTGSRRPAANKTHHCRVCDCVQQSLNVYNLPLCGPRVVVVTQPVVACGAGFQERDASIGSNSHICRCAHRIAPRDSHRHMQADAKLLNVRVQGLEVQIFPGVLKAIESVKVLKCIWVHCRSEKQTTVTFVHMRIIILIM